jgi:hypothetical protein
MPLAWLCVCLKAGILFNTPWRAQRETFMAIFRITAVIFLFVFSCACFAQASLVLKNTDGKTVGWLLGKSKGSYEYQYLTPDGYILSINGIGALTSGINTQFSELLYESNDCQGEPRIRATELGYEGLGEIVQIGNLFSPLFARLPYAANPIIRTIRSAKAPPGVCTALGAPEDLVIWIRVLEVDPLTYGITEDQISRWRVSIGSQEVQRPDIILCDGFESCP